MRDLLLLALVVGLTQPLPAQAPDDNADFLVLGGVAPRYSWTFRKERLDDSRFIAGKEGLPATLQGPARFVGGKGPVEEAVVLEGKKNRIVVSEDLSSVRFSTKSIWIEARVNILQPLPWGGIVGAFQDNGKFERGFILGFQNDRFSFGIATEATKGITYLASQRPFVPTHWYHVIGSYDGETARLFVDGALVAESDKPGGAILLAERGHFEIGAYHDDDENFRTTGMLSTVSIWDTCEDPDQRLAELRESRPDPDRENAPRRPLPPSDLRERYGPFDTVHGPFVEFTDTTTARITWDTATHLTSVLEIREEGGELRRLEDKRHKRLHQFTIPGIEPETVFRYRIRGESSDKTMLTPLYEFDSSFNYSPPRPEIGDWAGPADRFTALYEKTSKLIVERAGTSKGYCLVIGAGDGRLAYHLARLTDWQIIVTDRDAARVNSVRKAIDATGIYGTRISVHHVEGKTPPYGPYLANVIVSDDMLHSGELPANAAGLYKILRPNGGLLLLGTWNGTARTPRTHATFDEWLLSAGKTGGDSEYFRSEECDGAFWSHRRGPLEGARDWTHQYGKPDNSACSDDELVAGPMQVAWYGRPGPRPMPDRGPRNPAPVSANGRLYMQGNRVLFGLDSYNGTVLWSRQIPTMRRANMPRSSSNMVATADRVFVAIGDTCVGFDGQTGARASDWRLPAQSAGSQHEWGYLAVSEGSVVGSATIRGGNYSGDNGEWYEDFKEAEVAKVTSQRIFARDPTTGAEKWSYEGGVVVNSTITISDGVVYFVESRNKAAREARVGRLAGELEKEQFIVALNLDSGSTLWELPHDLSQCRYTTYMSHSADTLLVSGTDDKKRYHTWAFDTRDRKLRWEHHSEAKKTHHSGHLMRPVIVKNRAFLNKHTFDLASGKVLEVDPFDYHGCGTMAASANAIFHRFEYHGMLDLRTKKRTEFVGVRGSCWLGQIPSGGLLLAPESGAGCSCTHAFQTSLAFVPRGEEPPEAPPETPAKPSNDDDARQ